MSLHWGAAMHRHEYSPAEKSQPPRRSLSAFPTPLPRRASTYDRPSPIPQRPTVPSRPASEYIPRTREPVVRFSEPELDVMSEDGRSVANSEGSEVTAGGGRGRKRSTRTSTAFHLAHPAPTLTQKQRLLQIRPKLLLQLQRLSTDSRPKPVTDVLTSTIVIPRLVQKFPRMFRGKAELGANDVMVVKSEEYDTSDNRIVEDTDSDEEGLGNRELMAVICQMRKDCGGSQGRAEIVLSDGSVWIATPLPNGLYEFVTVDERGDKITARWVRRSPRRGTVDSPSGANEFKFTFSIIDPNSRRHPILASITQSTLDIPDSYISVSSSAGKFPPTSPLRGSPSDPDWQIPAKESNWERTTHFIDDNMKTLIQVTGIWVALRQGLSPYFRYNDAMAMGSPSSLLRNGSAGGRVKGLTTSPEPDRPSPPGTTSSTAESTQSIFAGRKRSRCAKGSPSSAGSSQTEQGRLPRRAVSTGSAFMLRAAARRVGNLPSTVASESEGEGIFTLPKRAATVNLKGGLGMEILTPERRSFSGSSATHIDTPTKNQQRSQAVYVPSTTQQHSFMNGNIERHSVDFTEGQRPSEAGEKSKVSRWNTFKDFFRRFHGTARSS